MKLKIFVVVVRRLNLSAATCHDNQMNPARSKKIIWVFRCVSEENFQPLNGGNMNCYTCNATTYTLLLFSWMWVSHRSMFIYTFAWHSKGTHKIFPFDSDVIGLQFFTFLAKLHWISSCEMSALHIKNFRFHWKNGVSQVSNLA